MKSKYQKVGLDFDLINSKFKDINEYERTVNVFFEDPHFEELKVFIEDGDYGMAKDAVKGLYTLSLELYLMPLYMILVDMYEDLEYENYKDLPNKYNEMYSKYKEIRTIFYA